MTHTVSVAAVVPPSGWADYCCAVGIEVKAVPLKRSPRTATLPEVTVNWADPTRQTARNLLQSPYSLAKTWVHASRKTLRTTPGKEAPIGRLNSIGSDAAQYSPWNGGNRIAASVRIEFPMASLRPQ
jgi:hypothetical protein